MEEAVSKEQFRKFLQHPEEMEADRALQLRHRYPYCHSLWLMEAKRASQSEEEHLPATYNQAALFAKSPEQLYGYIHSDIIPEQREETSMEDLSVDPVVQLDQVLDKNISKQEEEVPEEPVFGVSAIDEPAAVSPVLEEESLQEKSDIAKYDDELMPYTFVWWLHKTRMAYADTYQPYASQARAKQDQSNENPDYTILDQQIRENIFHLQPPEEKLSVKTSRPKTTYKISNKTDELIDRFIQEEPQIKPPQASKITLENKARQSAEDQSSFVSETLASIYAEQGLYQKAIDAYLKLSLKYPEKSTYFADRIKALEGKIN